MTNEKQTFDELKCGNCGYDGGLAHTKEKLKWQEDFHAIQTKLTKAEQVSNETHQHRVWVIGIASVICMAILSYASCEVIPKTVEAAHPIQKSVLPVNPVVNAQETLKDMYNKCVEQSHVDNRQDTAAGIRACNDTFGVQIQRLESTAEEKK